MIETICNKCGSRYRPGTDHECKAKPPAKKSPTGRVAPDAGAVKVKAARPKEADANGSSGGRAAASSSPPTGRVRLPLGQDSGKTSPEGSAPPAIIILADAEAKAAHLAPKRGRGRPRGPVPFDKKAHARKKAKERRAAAKAKT